MEGPAVERGLTIGPIGKWARILCGLLCLGAAFSLPARSGWAWWPLTGLLTFLAISLLLAGLWGEPG